MKNSWNFWYIDDKIYKQRTLKKRKRRRSTAHFKAFFPSTIHFKTKFSHSFVFFGVFFLKKKDKEDEEGVKKKNFVESVELLCFLSHDEWKKCLENITLHWDPYWNVRMWFKPSQKLQLRIRRDRHGLGIHFPTFLGLSHPS